MIRSGGTLGRATAALLALGLLLAAVPAAAAPARIILLRHGEKNGPWELCEVGRERARALVSYYLGKNAQNSLFRPGETPRAILAISLHTLETISPVAQSWGMPVIFYSAIPVRRNGKLVLSDETLAQRTREAARDILEKPEWVGQTLVVNWEHDHIAKTRYDTPAAAEKGGTGAKGPEAVTLYDLLGLDRLPQVPRNWPRNTYDYFWIIDFDQTSGKPSRFSMIKEEFGPPFASLPQNDWHKPEGSGVAAGCTP